jgi:L-malate glycosyltransferase
LKILLAVETLYPGGAELFVLRLASRLGKKHEVIFYRLYKDAVNQEMLNAYPKNFTLEWPEVPFDFFIQKTDRLLRLLRIDFSIRAQFVKHSIRKILRERKIEVVHSNQFKVDHILAQTISDQAFVITLHGDYKTFDNLQTSRGALNFSNKLKSIMGKHPAFAFISDEQQQYMLAKNPAATLSLTKIYNGYYGEAHPQQKANADFTFGMVARGIKEKGWQIAIDAFLKVQQSFPQTKLILVGDSDYIKELKSIYGNNSRIEFAGYSSTPLEFIEIFDVGLLPSYYSSESLPTTVIEYLYCGVPVIASNVGEISKMIATPSGLSGQIMDIQENNSDADRLSLLMESYLKNPELYQRHQQLTKAAFEKFNMDRCVEAYEKLYQPAGGNV